MGALRRPRRPRLRPRPRLVFPTSTPAAGFALHSAFAATPGFFPPRLPSSDASGAKARFVKARLVPLEPNKAYPPLCFDRSRMPCYIALTTSFRALPTWLSVLSHLDASDSLSSPGVQLLISIQRCRRWIPSSCASRTPQLLLPRQVTSSLTL